MRFSDFLLVSDPSDLEFIVGYTEDENIRINVSDFFGNQIFGSGNPGYIPVFTGTQTLGNSQIFQDGSNIVIGGVNAMGYRLAVGGSLYTANGAVINSTVLGADALRVIGGDGDIFVIPNDLGQSISSLRRIIHPPAVLTTESATLGQVNTAISNLENDIDILLDLKVDKTSIGVPNGVASLDSGGKVPLSQIPDSIIGQVQYMGTWNAFTNTPTLNPLVPEERGHYYVVSAAGVFGGVDYQIGDWIISNGVIWEKVDNTDAVTSVFGRIGAILALEGDYQAFYPRLSQTYDNPTWINTLAFTKITGVPAFLLENQTITLSGDVTGSGKTSIASTISNNAVTDSKLRDSVGTSVIGRSASTTGDPADIQATTDGHVLLRSAGNLLFGLISGDSISSIDWSKITGTPTTLSGYGITNAYTKTESDNKFVPYTGASTNVNLGSNNITANSFIKAGGTSSQFLKADGSVDTSQYVPTTRSVNAGTGLTGGGNLSSDITIAFDTTWGDNRYAYRTRQLTINGTTYDLSADRTWTVGTVNTLTTTGTSGPATLVGNTLNIPQYTDQFVGTVTSVGLSMPAAFTVSNSPITSAGTLTVVGAGTAAQYVRGDGTLADFPSGGGGGGSSVSYYLNGSVSQGTFVGNTYYEMNKTPIFGAGTDFSVSSDGYIAQFITDAGDPNSLLIPAGNWNFETYFNASSSGGTPSFYIELYKYNGTTFTLIASNSANPEFIAFGTIVNPYFSALAVPETILAITDRLAVRIYVVTSGKTITLHTENSNLCQVVTTFSRGLTALNGLTEQVQYFQVGTSGTDFNISSSVATHTFNLPTASAVNRGALSSADWAIFNSKQNAITLTTTGTSGVSTLVGSTLNIPNYSTDLTGYVPYTGATQAVNLGYNQLLASTLTINGDSLTGGSYLGFKHSTSVNSGANGYTSIYTFGTNLIGFKSISGATTKDFSFSMAGITPGIPGGRVYTMPDADGTIALLSDIPSLAGYVTLDTTQTITGFKTILRGGDVLNFKIGTDTLYGLKVAYNQNELVPSGEATWSFVNTFNRNGTGYETTPISFFRGVLVTGERLLSASINTNLLDYYGNNPSGRYPIYAYNTGVQQFASSIIVGETTGVVDAITGAIADLPAGVVANFKGRVIGSNAVNNNEFATLGQVTSTSRAAISLTTTGTSGPATYSSVTGILNIPEYQGGVTSFNTRTGAVTLTSSDVTTALGYTPVTDARTLTINGVTYDLTANRTWTVGVNPSAREIQTYIATASQTTFTVTGGYTVGLVDVFINGVRLTSSDYTATNGTTVVLTVGTMVGNIVDIIKYTSGLVNSISGTGTTNELAYFTASTTIASLSTATYPSLTELSYVKGVTSSIQTQLNGKQNTLTNPVTGTGTTNTLPKFTGSTTLGNSLFTDDGTNGAFGGANYSTGTSVRTFNISAPLYPGVAFWANNILTGSIFGYSVTGNIVISADSNNVFSDTKILMSVDGTERFGIFSDGNVTIANSPTNAGFKLDVSGTGRFTSSVTSLVNNILADGAGVVLQGYVDNTLRIAVRGSGYNDGARGGLLASTGDFSYGGTFTIPSESPASGNVALIARTSNGANDIFRWFDGATQLGVIKNSGNIGIGVVPSAWAAPTIGKVIQLGDRAALFSYNNRTLDLSTNLYFDGSDYRYLQSAFATLLRSDSTDGSFIFYSAASGTAGSTVPLTPRMHINSIGNVGIGLTPNTIYGNLQIKATSGVYSLDLVGRTAGLNSESQISFWNSAQSSVLAYLYNTGSNLYLGTGGNQPFTLSSGGNFIFGSSTVDNGARLQVIGSSFAFSVTGSNGAIAGTGLSYINNSDDAFALVLNNNGLSNQNDRGVFEVRRQGNSIFRINNTGNVGIGTSTPASSTKLSVAGTIAFGNNTDGTANLSYGGRASAKITSVTGGAGATLIHRGLGSVGYFILVSGLHSGNRFMDLIYGTGGNTPIVLASNTENTAPTRTYSISGENIFVSLTGVTAVWTVTTTGLGAMEA